MREKNYFGVRVRMRACVPACLRACELACVFVCTCFLYLGRFTERGAVGFGGSAGGTAHGRAAHSLAFRAIFHLAHFLGAAHRARRLFTVHFALGAFVRFAVHLTVGARAHRVALGRADGVVAQPFTLGVLATWKNGAKLRNALLWGLFEKAYVCFVVVFMKESNVVTMVNL